MSKAIRFLRSLKKLGSISAWKHFVHLSELTNFDHQVSVSWSQAGEDLALLAVIGDQKMGSYIDIGAHHPSRFSVTRHLYRLGWSGVNVEANPDLISRFEKERSRDTNLCVAVGLKPTYSFSIFEEPALSTFDSGWRDKFISENNKISKVVEVEGRKLRRILDEFSPVNRIDLLSIDAEGSDLQVLQSLELATLDESRFPKWLLLEAAPPVRNALETPAVKLAIEFGYEPHFVLAMSTLLKFED
jgi:FkbM family methyltransferase